MNGNFFSLFNLPGRQFRPEAIISLGELMAIPYGMPSSNIFSGYVYLGQFLVHDISRLRSGDQKPLFHHQPIETLEQLRNPSLDLDSLYGSGYRRENIPVNNGRMELGQVVDENGNYFSDEDLPRIPGKLTPMIGDSRNDENLITAQLHLQFLKLHNLLCDAVENKTPGLNGEKIYVGARKQLTLLYQQLILHDFLSQLLDEEVWDYVIGNDVGTLWDPEPVEAGRIPIEFSGAAMRFGHSMVLDMYVLNAGRNRLASLDELFLQTSRGFFNNTFRLYNNFVIDWRFFFDFEGLADTHKPLGARNIALNINTNVTMRIKELQMLHGYHFDSIANKNLVRGNQLNLPSGQDVANYLLRQQRFSALQMKTGINKTYIDELHLAIAGHPLIKVVNAFHPGIDKVTPLWFYLLAESELMNYGVRLGKISSLIIAEVIRGLIKTSSTCCFREKHHVEISNNSIAIKDSPTGQIYSFAQLLMAVHPDY